MKLLVACFALCLGLMRSARATEEAAPEEAAFHSAARLYQGSAQDHSAAADAFRGFVERYPHSRRAADASFAAGEADFARALSLADADSSFARDRTGARIPETALKSFEEAAQAYAAAAKKAGDDGMRSTANYRLGEVAYNERDWEKAAKYFSDVVSSWPKSYAVPAGLLGLVQSSLAHDDFAQAEADLQKLSSGYPERMKDPAVAFVQGILALHRGDGARAEQFLSALDSPEARYFLGKTYLAEQKPLLAATVFNRLAEDAPAADLREAASFFLGDAFFLSKDYDGAIARYSTFVKSFPFSRFKAAALYRLGSSSFKKGDYGQARLFLGSLISQYPTDFYAAPARYLIGESYLVVGQMREALFAYSEVASGGRKDLQPQALYRLAWAQQSLGDDARAVMTCQSFIDLYPAHPLAKDVYLILGNSLARLRKPMPASQAFQRILDIAPGSDVAEQALFLMLKLQYDQKNYSAILTSYQYILRQLPQSVSKWRGLCYLTAAEAYVRLGRVEEAQPIYEMLLKTYANDQISVYAQDGLAWCFELSGRHKESLAARQRLKEMLEVESSTFSFAANDLSIADSFYAQKDYADAFTFYDKFATDHPSSPALAPALYRAGFSLYRQKYYSQAIEVWRKLLEKAPSSTEAAKASYQIADTLFRSGKREEAAAAYKEILDRDPKGASAPMAALRLAQIAYYANQDDQALEEVKSLLSSYPKADEAGDALDLAEAVFDRDPQRDSSAFFSGLVEADPRSAAAGEIQFRLGRRLYEKKDYVGAARELERFSVEYTGHPSLAKAQLLIGECYEQQQMQAEAAAAFERFTVNYPAAEEVPLALFKLAGADFSLKLYGKAAAAYERLLGEFPKSEYVKAARFNLALAYRDNGQLDQAATVYSSYMASPGVGEDEAQDARWEVVAIDKERKDYAGARKELEDIRAKAKPGSEADLNAAYQAGELAVAAGDPDGARRAWESMIVLRPANSPYRLQALVKVVEMYEKASDWTKAIAVYEDLARNAASPAMADAARAHIKELRDSAAPAARAGDR